MKDARGIHALDVLTKPPAVSPLVQARSHCLHFPACQTLSPETEGTQVPQIRNATSLFCNFARHSLSYCCRGTDLNCELTDTVNDTDTISRRTTIPRFYQLPLTPKYPPPLFSRQNGCVYKTQVLLFNPHRASFIAAPNKAILRSGSLLKPLLNEFRTSEDVKKGY